MQSIHSGLYGLESLPTVSLWMRLGTISGLDNLIEGHDVEYQQEELLTAKGEETAA